MLTEIPHIPDITKIKSKSDNNVLLYIVIHYYTFIIQITTKTVARNQIVIALNEVCQNAAFSKIDLTMTTVNKKF